MGQLSGNDLGDTRDQSLIDDYDALFRLRLEADDYQDDDFLSSEIEQRVKDTQQDDTHPSTDADLDYFELYDRGLG